MEVNIYSVPAAVIREGLQNLGLKQSVIFSVNGYSHTLRLRNKQPLLAWVSNPAPTDTITNVFLWPQVVCWSWNHLWTPDKKEFWNKVTISGLRMRGKKQQELSSQPTSKTQIFLWSSIMHFYRFLFFFSLFTWSVFCNVIPPSPSYSPFRSFYSDSSNPSDYLWVLSFLKWIISVRVCVSVSNGMDGCGSEYLMICWMSTMHNIPHFPPQPLDTAEGGKPGRVCRGGRDRQRGRERETERERGRDVSQDEDFIGKRSVEHFFT